MRRSRRLRRRVSFILKSPKEILGLLLFLTRIKLYIPFNKNISWDADKLGVDSQAKRGLGNYKFPGRVNQSMDFGMENESPGSGHRHKRAQATLSLPQVILRRKNRNSSFTLDKSLMALHFPALHKNKEPIIKHIVESSNVSKIADSKAVSSITGVATTMRLSNLREISPMVNLPKSYQKQLDEGSEELLKIFYSIHAGVASTRKAISYSIVKNVRIRKSEFRSFLSKRYTSSIAEKLINFFDFKKPWSYHDYVNAMEVLIYQNDELLFKIAFEALDFNCDDYISEIDLYLAMRELPNEVFISVLMDDFLKVIQYLIDKKKMKGTFDETKYNQEKIKMQIMNATYRSSLSDWKKEGQGKSSPNFFQFCLSKLSPNEKKGPQKSDYSLYKRSVNNSARKLEKNTDSLSISRFNSINSYRKKTLNKEDLLFGYCEERELNEKIPLNEFNAIHFDHFVPNFAIDLIKFLCGYSKVKLASSNSREYLKVHRNEEEFQKLMEIIEIQEAKGKNQLNFFVKSNLSVQNKNSSK
ncbi:unnamed protein product [Moneuplotes crassus]|uniref:EF-hand domain-containing protein n=1 Tax=Euplotes crassus TaxID=5936 RepID=A0AAD1U3A6_EUPCR|nr:unnamed protein product [Moneuplotes crassus]